MTTYTKDGFQKVEITPAMLASAQAKADALPPLRNSIRKGAGNLVGFLGEEIVLAAWPTMTRAANTYNFDIILTLDGRDYRVEVKSKQRARDPALHYECSVSDANTTQAADFYCFTSIVMNSSGQYTHGHILGLTEKSEYTKRAKFLRKGDHDPSNNFFAKADCWNVEIETLARF